MVVGSGEPAGVSFLGDLSVSGKAKSSASSSSLKTRQQLDRVVQLRVDLSKIPRVQIHQATMNLR